MARVLESPAGQGEGTFCLPWRPGEWPRIRARIGLETDQPGPQEVGEALFHALFSGQVGLLWARSLGVLPDRGLRVQLRFKLDEQPMGLSPLHSLPWELLRQQDTRDFLALSRLTPVVRYLEVPRPVTPFRRPAVLRILVVISAPAGLPLLNVVRERREIENAWGGRRDVEVDFLEQAQVEALREALLCLPYHILHFIGHGKLNSRTGEGFLAFEKGNGEADLVSGEKLFTLLRDVASLRLVFLNACESGRAVREEEFDPFAGVATALVMAGLPAVVAMQLPISDSAAITFSRAVHLRLAAGDPLDVAVTAGRQAVFARNHDAMEWAVPVLFTRIADGEIFEAGELQVEEVSPVPPSGRRQRRLQVGLAVGLTVLLAMLLAQTLRHPETIDQALMTLPGAVQRPALDRVRVGSFSIGRYEVTQREFLQFVLANPQWRRDRIAPGFHDGDYLKSWISWRQSPPELDTYPVNQVSWYAAEAFCEWVGGRLPTIAEWQAAAHTAEHRFPWGASQPARPALNFCDRVCPERHRGISPALVQDGFPETSPVGSFPAGRTREGICDLSGNVWEWTAAASGAERATLGGSYLAQFDECSTDRPLWAEARLCAPDGGFRCLWK